MGICYGYILTLPECVSNTWFGYTSKQTAALDREEKHTARGAFHVGRHDATQGLINRLSPAKKESHIG